MDGLWHIVVVRVEPQFLVPLLDEDVGLFFRWRQDVMDGLWIQGGHVRAVEKRRSRTCFI